MSTDLFISYAWTSNAHRAWVRMLASQLHLMGYAIKIDEAVDYGSSLNGFMREVTGAAHVLLIADENYVERANMQPSSGVGIETKWIRSVYASKSASWLSVIFVGNPNYKLPKWLQKKNPKGFDFNSDPEKSEYPGSSQIDAVWRWLEGLPADKTHAIPLSAFCKRAARLERVDSLRDPANYVNPALNGRVTFRYRDNDSYTVGNCEYLFKICISGCSHNSVYVLIDRGLKAIGLITTENFDPLTVDSFLTPGRFVTPREGQKVVLLNSNGILCLLTIEEVQQEINAKKYVPGHVTFTYAILVNQ